MVRCFNNKIHLTCLEYLLCGSLPGPFMISYEGIRAEGSGF